MEDAHIQEITSKIIIIHYFSINNYVYLDSFFQITVNNFFFFYRTKSVDARLFVG